MLPSSTSVCRNVSNAAEWQHIYALHIHSHVLSRLKEEAAVRTKGVKMRAEELHLLYIGYRQLTVHELDHYDEATAPPVPYPFRDQINTTAYVSAFMPSCLYIVPGEDAWRSGGCKVSSSQIRLLKSFAKS
ncbi:unnamed protein product [Hydatigera taeniaeformis]|uniref:ARID domain-containing protein n=1 Tax=Hydatigena taeniaeformis TaxID=6205 RepID=A0A0R3WKK7_HYDTA|nr:unnamed protein product [Hydatigera taeniaeformis]